MRTVTTFHAAKAKIATPTEARMSGPQPVRQELEGDRRDDRLVRLDEHDVAVDLAEHEREPERQAELAEEDDRRASA